MKVWLILGVVALLWGCSSSGRVRSERAESRATLHRVQDRMVPDRSMKLEGVDVVFAPAVPQKSVSSPPVEGEKSISGNQARMVFYHGEIALKSPEPEKSLDTATRWVTAAGGYVESRNPGVVVLRIPVAQFRTLFEQMLGLGAVQNKWMEAEDITEQFRDTDLRIRIHSATLARLQDLLAASTDDSEKLQLLREIARVNDELEALRNVKRVLENQAAYSRLELRAEPFVFGSGRYQSDIGAFRWMQQLQAQRLQQVVLGEKVELAVPKNFVQLELEQGWAARSADGAEVWAFSRDNEPHGDAAFWQAALAGVLGNAFAQQDTSGVGPFAVLRLQSFGPMAYVWWIAVAIDDDEIVVAEAFFPDALAESRHGDAVRTSWMGGVP